ncbi:hypothetical protein ACGF4C_14395 [Streptomyces sp. NPDC048197]|uniref:hypothetical protein n=1 Tax=Streptomyces sp. NPDC048197 TaxID=3365511 RepID=UPI003724241A
MAKHYDFKALTTLTMAIDQLSFFIGWARHRQALAGQFSGRRAWGLREATA